MRLDHDLEGLGSYPQMAEPQRRFTGGPSHDQAVSASGASEKQEPETWLLRAGSPTDVLSVTRDELFDELLRLRDDERQRIGQELHDSAGQLLLSLQLSVACVRESKDSRGKEALLDEISDTARLIEREIRALAFLNHPVDAPEGGLASAIKALVLGFGKRSGCHVTFDEVGRPKVRNSLTAMTLLRVAQEAMVNVHRHARASHVAVRLEKHGDRLDLVIEDDGIGFPSAAQMQARGGVGVEGMKYRLQRVGGSFNVSSGKNGTRITASVPLREPIPGFC